MLDVSRRRFLGLSAGLAAAGLVRLPSLRAAEPGNYGGFQMGIQSYTLRKYKIDEALQLTQDLGLTRIEFFPGHFPVTTDAAPLEEMAKKLAAHGLKPTAHGVNHFGKDHNANRKLFQFAKQAGIANLTADPDEAAFESLDQLVKEFDIRIAIHNHGPGHRYDKIDNVLSAVKNYDKRIGACADLGHFIRSGEDPVKAITLLGDRLYGIHLKDFDAQKKDAKGVILGKGHLDVVEVFKALKRVNFPADGALSLEYEEHPDNPLDDVRACLAIASEAAQKAVA